MTKFAVDLGMNPYLAILCGFVACIAFGFLNGTPHHLIRAAAVYRYARHVEYRLRPHPDLFELADRVRTADAMLFPGQRFRIGNRA
jgi:hypothetical protein